MIRGNADIVAIVILIGAAIFGSGARQFMTSEVSVAERFVLNRQNDAVRQASYLPLCGTQRRSAVMVVAPLPPVAPLPFAR